MKPLNFVGIDVSAKELVVQLEKDEQLLNIATFDNTSAGHNALLRYITKGGRSARVCMEATGVYHFELAVRLSHSPRVEVMVANPRAIKHFSIASMSRGKTDPLDAAVILHYLKCMKFQLWEVPNENCLILQKLARRMHQLKNSIRCEVNRRISTSYQRATAKLINRDIDAHIKQLKKQVASLQAKAIQLVQADSELKAKFDLLCSIKGIAEVSGIQILSELVCMPKDMQVKQWVAYAGLDPRPIESGSSLKKPRHISKAGNKYLRASLYMSSWVAVQHDEHVKAFFNKLIEKGKTKMVAIVAVMRKLLHAIWGMLNSKTTWQSEMFYKIESTNS